MSWLIMADASLISAGIGLLIGLVLALTGAGGSILAIPLLMFGLHVSLNQAAPIALLAVMLTASIGTFQGLRKGIVRYKTALLIAGFGVMFAPVGVWLAGHVPPQFLSITFAAVMLYVAWFMWQQSNAPAPTPQAVPDMPCMINKVSSKLYWTASCTKRLIATGACAGFVAGLLGVGGGFIMVPSLRKVSNFNMPTIVATSLMAIALVSVVSIASYSVSTPLLWHIAIPFILSTVFGLLLFSRFSHKIPALISQRGFALLAMLAAIIMLAKH